MANKQKGEISFALDDKTYTLSFSANALCELENELDLGVNEIIDKMSRADKLRVSIVRAVFWSALTDHHSDISLKEAGTILTKLTVVKAINLITQAFSAAFPEGDGKEKSEDPQKPDQGSGNG